MFSFLLFCLFISTRDKKLLQRLSNLRRWSWTWKIQRSVSKMKKKVVLKTKICGKTTQWHGRENKQTGSPLLPFAELRRLCCTVFKLSKSVCGSGCIRGVEEDGEEHSWSVHVWRWDEVKLQRTSFVANEVCMTQHQDKKRRRLRALRAVLTRAACACRGSCTCACWGSLCHACCPHRSCWYSCCKYTVFVAIFL